MPERRGETFVMEGSPEGAISFSTFVLSFASTAMIHLGEAPNPETGKAAMDLTLARQTLDLLAMLHEKTRGNLTREEEQLFASVLADLRLKFVGKTGA